MSGTWQNGQNKGNNFFKQCGQGLGGITGEKGNRFNLFGWYRQQTIKVLNVLIFFDPVIQLLRN